VLHPGLGRLGASELRGPSGYLHWLEEAADVELASMRQLLRGHEARHTAPAVQR
jgi:hypothetical protein